MIKKERLRDHFIHFSKFTLVGIIASLLNILFNWLLIDILEIKAVIAITAVVTSIFFLKFYLYALINLIKKQFLKYTSIQVISALLNIFFTWFLIEILLISTVIATTSVVLGLFVGRFLLFKITKLINN